MAVLIPDESAYRCSVDEEPTGLLNEPGTGVGMICPAIRQEIGDASGFLQIHSGGEQIYPGGLPRWRSYEEQNLGGQHSGGAVGGLAVPISPVGLVW